MSYLEEHMLSDHVIPSVAPTTNNFPLPFVSYRKTNKTIMGTEIFVSTIADLLNIHDAI